MRAYLTYTPRSDNAFDVRTDSQALRLKQPAPGVDRRNGVIVSGDENPLDSRLGRVGLDELGAPDVSLPPIPLARLVLKESRRPVEMSGQDEERAQ